MPRLKTELRNNRRDVLPRIPDEEDVAAIFTIPNEQRRNFAVKRLRQTLTKMYDLVQDEVELSRGQRRLLKNLGTTVDAEELTEIVTIFRDSLGDRVAFPKKSVQQETLELNQDLIDRATSTMRKLAKGKSKCLTHVFATVESQAMEVFREAADALDRLHKQKQIQLDSRKMMAAVNCKGLTSPRGILLPGDFADAGFDDQARILIHESTHAIENDWGASSFVDSPVAYSQPACCFSNSYGVR